MLIYKFDDGAAPVKILLLAAALALTTPAFASLELAQKNACLACHGVDKKIVGPAYQDVAKKYAGQKDAEDALVKSIKGGGSGKWGPIPMPAQAALSDADAHKLALWSLHGAK
jgi:cytochrome c